MKLFSILVFCFLTSCLLEAKNMTQSSDQASPLPKQVKRVFGSSPPMTYLLYALNPDKMIGLNFKAKNPNNSADKEFVGERFLSLPVIGSFHGGGNDINLESLMAYKPQLILVWQDDMRMQIVEREIIKTNIPTLFVEFREIEDMPKAFIKAGEAIGEKERGQRLAEFIQKSIDEVREATAKLKPVRYYYAEGIDGLSTECDQSFHVQALNFAGGENVHKCQQKGVLGLEKITFETLLNYDPEVIVVQNRAVYNDILLDPLWGRLSAVKNKRIYLVPTAPFNWLDRPPSFMRALGIEWLASVFHPEAHTIDLNDRIKAFYELFFNVHLNDEQIKNILRTSL
ncbi:MAG: iron complex transport system substrate-binding protein [Campylobacterota bacterium]|nr:iron complex transport system substrate-binding protein [Campylobacterota bacterium]